MEEVCPVPGCVKARPEEQSEALLTPAMKRILAALRLAGPMSCRDIAASAHVAKSSLDGGYLKHLKTTGMIHIAGWQKNGNGFTTPLYGAGAAKDCPMPHFSEHDRDSPGLARIVAALDRVGPMTYREIALAAGLSANTIKNSGYMDVLVRQQRVHISEWRRNRKGPMVAVYAEGPGQNAVKPAPLSQAEKMQRWRVKGVLFDTSNSLIKTLTLLMPAGGR
jgi:lambda repressor-like predicted transcriptional regulator